MSFGGLLATALAGGAAVVGKQAGDDIEQGRKADLMKQQADIEEQMRMRLAENQERIRQAGALADVTGPLGDAKRAYRKGELADTNDAAISLERGKIPVQQDVATAANETAVGLAKKNATDPAYLKSISVLKLADPVVAAQVAASYASAGASAAETKLRGEQLKQLGQVGAIAQQVRNMQEVLSTETDPIARSAIEQQITDLGFNGRDTKSFLAVAERAISNGDASLKIMNDQAADPAAKYAARKQLDIANEFAAKASAMAGINVSDKAAPAAAPQADIDFLKKNPAKAADFDAKYGQGAASKVLGDAPPPKTAAKPAGMLAGVPATPAPAEKQTPQQRAAEIQQKLAVDDDIKSGFGGSGARMLKNRALPLGMAERRSLEEELQRLNGDR